MRFAVSEEIDRVPVDSDIRRSFRATISKIEKLGGEIAEIKLTSAKTSGDISSIILLAEAATQHTELLGTHSDQYGTNVITRFRAGQEIQTDAYIKASRNREVITREFERLFQKYDFYLTPTVQILPPKIGQEVVTIDSIEVNVVGGCTQFTRLGNLTGMPSIALPCGFSSNSLPLSIQIMGPKLGEIELLKVAYVLEQSS
jgi:aspartyl-tRNA(Asn)/glutamyl-tRNA(Gln) amidotransferase subunit A